MPMSYQRVAARDSAGGRSLFAIEDHDIGLLAAGNVDSHREDLAVSGQLDFPAGENLPVDLVDAVDVAIVDPVPRRRVAARDARSGAGVFFAIKLKALNHLSAGVDKGEA